MVVLAGLALLVVHQVRRPAVGSVLGQVGPYGRRDDVVEAERPWRLGWGSRIDLVTAEPADRFLGLHLGAQPSVGRRPRGVPAQMYTGWLAQSANVTSRPRHAQRQISLSAGIGSMGASLVSDDR